MRTLIIGYIIFMIEIINYELSIKILYVFFRMSIFADEHIFGNGKYSKNS